MANRKAIPKKIRFEVFKRDHFTCQYCGKMAPDVILEVDHIHPVAEGGTNEIVNLITACRDCNRGKGKRKLSDNDELKKQQASLEELAERREQAEMMAEWRQALANTETEIAQKAGDYIESLSHSGVSEFGLKDLKKLIKNFSFREVMDAIEIAYDHYYTGDDRSWEKAFGKIGGICYNRRKNAEASQITLHISLPSDVIRQIRAEMNEIGFTEEFSIEDYIAHCLCIEHLENTQGVGKHGEV